MAKEATGRHDAEEAGVRALLQCLLVMAGADRALTLSEIETVSQLYAEAAGRAVDQTMISQIFTELKTCDAAAALNDLRRTSGSLDEPTRERIVKASYTVMVADRKIDHREAQRLSQIADALGIAETRLPALMRAARL